MNIFCKKKKKTAGTERGTVQWVALTSEGRTALQGAETGIDGDREAKGRKRDIP
ncbi:MAG: hypothetical protein R2941_15500 [Desulfobacterales bacterium]